MQFGLWQAAAFVSSPIHLFLSSSVVLVDLLREHVLLIDVLAAFISLRSIVIVDLLGIEKLTNAFGLIALFQGIVALVGSPISGKFPQ